MEKTLKLNSEIEFLSGDAYASVSLNPYFQWAKVIITDDLPNANKQRVPVEEFENLIRTGTLSPVKMEYGKPTDHEDARGKPIGAIASIVKETNKLIALLALWKKERPDDISMLKDMYTKNTPPQVSWEISYAESETKEDIEDLKGTVLTGLTVVENPAYTGRTAFVAMSSLESDAEKWTREYINDLPDSAFLYLEPGGDKDADGKTTPRSLRHLPYKNSSGEIDAGHLRNAISRLGQPGTGTGEDSWLTESLRERLLAKARKLLGSNSSLEDNMTLEELQAELEQLKTKHAQLENELKTKQAELDELKSYKDSVEAEKAKAEKESKIRTKFKEANVEKDETYFTENMPKFLGMSDELLDFIVQEFVAFSQKKTDASNKGPKIPPITGEDNTDLDDPKELGRLLREAKSKK